MTPEQKAISNGLYAIHAIDSSKKHLNWTNYYIASNKNLFNRDIQSDFQKSINLLNEMLTRETEMLKEAEPYLSNYLATLDDNSI